MKRLMAIALTALFLIALVGCSTGTSSTASTAAPSAEASTGAASTGSTGSSGKMLVAFSQGDNGNSWRATNTDDMQAWAEKSGYDYIWADAQADASKQLSDIQDLLSRSPDVLIVAPVQAEALDPCVELATQAGVPLVTIDRSLTIPVGEGTYSATIVQDFVEAGRICGRYIVDLLTERYGEPKGAVLEITGTIGSSPVVDQSKGIREILDEYPDIEIVDSQSGDYKRDNARAIMDDFLNKYPEGSVDCLVSYNDDMTIGAMQAMRDANRLELMGSIISKDGSRDALKEVVEGNILVIPQCTPYFGEVTFQLVDKLLAGEDYETFTNIPFKTFDMLEDKAMTEEYYQKLVDEDLYY